MKLSNRLRPDVEAAPWVIDEVKKLEVELAEAYRELRKQLRYTETVFNRELCERAQAAAKLESPDD